MSSKVVHWLQDHETRLFHFVNQRIQHNFLDHFFTKITHLGGATASIMISLCLACFGQGSLRIAGTSSTDGFDDQPYPCCYYEKEIP